MKKLIFIFFIIIKSGFLFATAQEPDFLHYNGQKLTLSTGWGHPSPLQTYYSQNNIEYPFTMLHTANYRGHIAIWEVLENKLFLKEIQIEKVNYKPEKYKIKSISDSLSFKDKVFADWFTGVIIGEIRNKQNYWKVEKSIYFYVKYGQVIDIQEISDKDFKKIETISEKDTADYELMAKYSMLYLNNNYISYYFRINGNDTITINTKGGYLDGNSGLSPVLSYFENDHMKWPYNWENFEKSGAPFCTWSIENDSLLLTNIELHTGTGFYSIDKYSVDLVDIFPNRIIDNKVFGDWVSGIFIVRHGENKEDEKLPGYIRFKTSEFTYIRLKDGILLENYTVPANFDFENSPASTHEGLKKILDELNKTTTHNN
ncbi:hypothetical protein [Aureibacter tunicatorum]|uniref:GLPGLI family protein n=1 Tax=Aureibacter tunicatorum TaxID=866807 RepID=A0AAE3XQX1_9BACT|nr:hypothetical protein [Aureibacter tunicatorum]MDR6241113.1 hypothetical protein [Aureibacter tunicatorum]BDD03891.1 hypothetical protein AUTU_13740 [Aureibacter tunicatorum]